MLRACTTEVADNMEIITHDPEIVGVRRSVLELIMSNHPKDCLICARLGRAMSAAVAMRPSSQSTNAGVP